MKSTTLSYDRLTELARHGTAIRAVTRLQPAGGRGDKVFPPTYAEGAGGTRYAFETRRIDGAECRCVLVDSVASQANRMEEALRRARDEGRITFPVVEVDFSGVPGLEDIDRITDLDAPHRAADAILRDSLLDGTPFRFTEPGVALTEARPQHAAPLFKWSPASLVFGVWDSTGPRGGMGSKFPRTVVSEIVGVHAVPGVKTASRMDPLGIEIKAATLFEAKDKREMWTLDEADANAEKGKPRKYGRSKSESGKPSAANHGNIAPTLDEMAGGVTVDHALQVTVVSLTAIRRLRFPKDTAGNAVPREVRADVEATAHAALAALALAGVCLAREQGYWLRSRCHLVPEGGEPLALEVLGRNGEVEETFALSGNDAAALVEACAREAAAKGMAWHEGGVTLRPAPKLVTLVSRSRELVAAGEVSEEGA